MANRPMLTLYTTMRELEQLHDRHDRTRSTSRTVTIDRQALIHILMDHAQMVDALRNIGQIGIVEGD